MPNSNASFGIGIEEALGQNDDLIGLAYSWQQPANRERPEQHVLEAFYRIWVTLLIHVTPDLQVVIDPANSPTEAAVAVFGLRVRTLF